MFTGWKSQVLVIKYPRCFDCRQIVSVGEQLMQVFRISKQGSWGLHIHLGYCALSLGVCCQKFWDCMVISPSRVKCSVKKWISLDIWAFKLRPLSILEMLSSKHIVAECNAAEWWSPPVLTYVLEELATSIFRVVQEDPPSLRWYKKRVLLSFPEDRGSKLLQIGKCLPLNIMSCEKTWIFISTA